MVSHMFLTIHARMHTQEHKVSRRWVIRESELVGGIGGGYYKNRLRIIMKFSNNK